MSHPSWSARVLHIRWAQVINLTSASLYVQAGQQISQHIRGRPTPQNNGAIMAEQAARVVTAFCSLKCATCHLPQQRRASGAYSSEGLENGDRSMEQDRDAVSA